MRNRFMVELGVVLDVELPVRGGDVVLAVHPFPLGGAGAGEAFDRRAEAVRQRRRLAGEVDEPEGPPAFEAQRTQGMCRLIEAGVRLHAGGALQRSVEAEDPAVVGAGDGACAAAGGGRIADRRQGGAAVRTDVVEGAYRAGGIAGKQDREAGDLGAVPAAERGDVAVMRDVQPAAGEEAFAFEAEDLRILVPVGRQAGGPLEGGRGPGGEEWFGGDVGDHVQPSRRAVPRALLPAGRPAGGSP